MSAQEQKKMAIHPYHTRSARKYRRRKKRKKKKRHGIIVGKKPRQKRKWLCGKFIDK